MHTWGDAQHAQRLAGRDSHMNSKRAGSRHDVERRTHAVRNDAAVEGTPITSLRGLGPASAEMLAAIGIESAEKLDEVGAAEAYRRLRAARVPGVTRVMLWALAGALLDLDWRELPEDLKQRLLQEVATAEGNRPS